MPADMHNIQHEMRRILKYQNIGILESCKVWSAGCTWWQLWLCKQPQITNEKRSNWKRKEKERLCVLASIQWEAKYCTRLPREQIQLQWELWLCKESVRSLTNDNRPSCDDKESPKDQGNGAPRQRRLIKLLQCAKQHDGSCIIQHALPKDQVVEHRRHVHVWKYGKGGDWICGRDQSTCKQNSFATWQHIVASHLQLVSTLLHSFAIKRIGMCVSLQLTWGLSAAYRPCGVLTLLCWYEHGWTHQKNRLITVWTGTITLLTAPCTSCQGPVYE